MKKILAVLGVAGAVLAGPVARAGDVHWAVGVDLGAVALGIGNAGHARATVVLPPPPVVVRPPVCPPRVVVAAPRCFPPPPVVVMPRAWCPPPRMLCTPRMDHHHPRHARHDHWHR